MTETRHLTAQQAHRLTLALQHIPAPAPDPLSVVRRLTAVQTQYRASLPGALWARTSNVTPEWIENALTRERTLVKIWTVRGTLHTVASADFGLLVGSYGRIGVKYNIARFRRELGITDDEMEDVLASMSAALSEGPLSRPEIHDRIPALARLTNVGWGHDMKVLVLRGDAVFAESRASTTPRFADSRQWLSHLPFEVPGQIDALAELIRRYLRGHAPASAAEIRVWIGIYASEFAPGWTRVVPELVPVTIEGQRGMYYLHPDDLAVLDNLPDPPPIRLLPKFDALTLAHRGRTSRLVGAPYYKRVYGAAAQVEALVLLDGDVAGTWRFRTTARRMVFTFDMFRALTRLEQSRIEQEAAKFAAWSGFADAEIN